MSAKTNNNVVSIKPQQSGPDSNHVSHLVDVRGLEVGRVVELPLKEGLSDMEIVSKAATTADESGKPRRLSLPREITLLNTGWNLYIEALEFKSGGFAQVVCGNGGSKVSIYEKIDAGTARYLIPFGSERTIFTVTYNPRANETRIVRHKIKVSKDKTEILAISEQIYYTNEGIIPDKFSHFRNVATAVKMKSINGTPGLFWADEPAVEEEQRQAA